MKRQEQDDLRVAEVRALARVADALEAPERRLRAERLEAAFPPMRRLFGSERGAVALLRSIPGFAGLWNRSVPDGYLLRVRDRAGEVWWIVMCPCGEQVALRPGMIGDCACGRWYFSTGESVRTKRFEAAAA